MLVVKRDGKSEPVAFDKITARIKKLCYGFDPKHVDPALVAQKVVAGVYDGVTTVALDDLASETSAFLTTQHPDYGRLAARIAVSNLHKQTEKSFTKTMLDMYSYVDPRTQEPAPLISDKLHDLILQHGDRLNAAIVYDRDFDYDFFGFKTLERSYLLKMVRTTRLPWAPKAQPRPPQLSAQQAVVHGSAAIFLLLLLRLRLREFWAATPPCPAHPPATFCLLTRRARSLFCAVPRPAPLQPVRPSPFSPRSTAR